MNFHRENCPLVVRGARKRRLYRRLAPRKASNALFLALWKDIRISGRRLQKRFTNLLRSVQLRGS